MTNSAIAQCLCSGLKETEGETIQRLQPARASLSNGHSRPEQDLLAFEHGPCIAQANSTEDKKMQAAVCRHLDERELTPG